ncbi:MAG: hypothetical protein WD766_11145 [Gemmatimonadota bacterium]
MIAQTLLAASLLTAVPEASPFPWFGEDKLRHFVASFVVSSLSGSGARLVGLDQRESIAVAAAVGTLGGVYKEVRDVRLGGPFSGYDLAWDVLGTGSAVLLLNASR